MRPLSSQEPTNSKKLTLQWYNFGSSNASKGRFSGLQKKSGRLSRVTLRLHRQTGRACIMRVKTGSAISGPIVVTSALNASPIDAQLHYYTSTQSEASTLQKIALTLTPVSQPSEQTSFNYLISLHTLII